MITAIVHLGLSALGFVIGLLVIVAAISLVVRLVAWIFRNPVVLLVLAGIVVLLIRWISTH